MITPNAFHLIIKYFDEIDARVTSRLFSKRPWGEIAITSIFCDLLDADMQVDEKVDYGIVQLNEDLEKDSGLFGISLSIETNQFSSNYERYVCQSDIGIRVIYENGIESKLSWEKFFLLQAKKLTHEFNKPTFYTDKSTFSSRNKDQEFRINLLEKIIGKSIKHLLYCPRPEKLERQISQKLAYLRLKILNKNIFDYIQGLEIHSEIANSHSTIGAGIFIAEDISEIKNLESVHAQIFSNTIPFSWFIAQLFLDNNNLKNADPEQQNITKRIIYGDEAVIKEIKGFMKESEFPDNFQVFPKCYITLRYRIAKGNNLVIR